MYVYTTRQTSLRSEDVGKSSSADLHEMQRESPNQHHLVTGSRDANNRFFPGLLDPFLKAALHQLLLS